jgi:hypothetical protein
MMHDDMKNYDKYRDWFIDDEREWINEHKKTEGEWKSYVVQEAGRQ